MPLTNQQVTACSKCVKENDGDPPCRRPNVLARETNHPLLTFVSSNTKYVEWPCYFHADWKELAPLLIGYLPPDEPYHASDLNLRATPGGPGERHFPMIKKDLIKYSGSKGREAVVRARSPQGMAAADYTVMGEKAFYKHNMALLYASHRDNRFQTWADSLADYHSTELSNLHFADSSWQFVTYGGGGSLIFTVGDVVLSKGGSQFTLDYVGLGVGLGLNVITASPNRFSTHGSFFKNMRRYGSDEPKLADFEGFCLVMNAAIAAGYGWGPETATAATLGGGTDVSWILCNIANPAGLIKGYGKTAGLSLSAGLSLGYMFIDR